MFHHLAEQMTLYGPYPEEYGDVNHYGVLFGVLIAPFAVMPCSNGDGTSGRLSLSYSIRLNYVLPYALKALPCALIWFKVCYEQLTCDFADKDR